MPRGDKSAYTSKQKRTAEHIEEGYEDRGLSENEAERRAWATVNKMDHGGKKSGLGRGRATNKGPARKGGRKGGRAAASSRKTSSRKTASRKTASRKTASRKTASRKGGTRKTSSSKGGARKSSSRRSR